MKLRARMYQSIRAFFDAQGYLEVDTPLLGISTNSDPHIHSVKATVMDHPVYLQTSPEFAMKRLLAAGSGSIYQICHAFRDEEKGSLHHPEFSLLEWYQVGSDYLGLMQQLEVLLGRLLNRDIRIQRLSYFDCFQRQLGLDLTNASEEQCQQKVTEYVPGIASENLTRDDCLDLLMSQVVSKSFSGYTWSMITPRRRPHWRGSSRITRCLPSVLSFFMMPWSWPTASANSPMRKSSDDASSRITGCAGSLAWKPIRWMRLFCRRWSRGCRSVPGWRWAWIVC